MESKSAFAEEIAGVERAMMAVNNAEYVPDDLEDDMLVEMAAAVRRLRAAVRVLDEAVRMENQRRVRALDEMDA